MTDLTAHYTSTAKRKTLTIVRGCSLRGIHMPGNDILVAEEEVRGIEMARRVAAFYNAKPWNF